MQGKSINSEKGEVRLVQNDFTAKCEAESITVTGSAWSVSGGLTIGATSFDDTSASAFVNVQDSGQTVNTVTFSDGQVIVLWRDVVA